MVVEIPCQTYTCIFTSRMNHVDNKQLVSEKPIDLDL